MPERPAAWVAVDKAGATVLFQDPQAKLSTLGVTLRCAEKMRLLLFAPSSAHAAHAPTLSPVTITSLRQFGTLQEVTDKLVKAERDKARGTLSAPGPPPHPAPCRMAPCGWTS